MPVIILETFIRAPIDRCFNLSRSVDAHLDSMKESSEHVVAGKSKGVLELGETVTWKARHFGLWHTLTSKITKLEFPRMFRDEMISGPFKTLQHDHVFVSLDGGTRMTDIFRYTIPGGKAAWPLDCLLIRPYMTILLEMRNEAIRTMAENTP